MISLTWVALPIILIILNFIFVGKKLFLRFWTGGLWLAVIVLLMHHLGQVLGLFYFQNSFYTINNTPISLLLAAFFFGVLFIRFQPSQKGWQLVYIFVISFLLVLIESFLLEMGLIIYVNWENIYSFFVNVLALIALSWLSDLTVSKRKGYFFH